MADKKEEKKARYSPGYSTFSPLLLLPSFGIRLSRSDARAKALPPGWGAAEITTPHSGDAFSADRWPWGTGGKTNGFQDECQ